MLFLNKLALLLLHCAQARCIHLCQCIDIVSSSQLGINLHDKLSLALKLLTLHHILTLEVEAGSVSVLGLPNFTHARLDDVIFQYDALLQLLSRLREPLLGCPVVSLVVSTLLVELQFESSGDIALQGQHVEVRVFFHKIGQTDQLIFDILIDTKILRHVTGHEVANIDVLDGVRVILNRIIKIIAFLRILPAGLCA